MCRDLQGEILYIFRSSGRGFDDLQIGSSAVDLRDTIRGQLSVEYPLAKVGYNHIGHALMTLCHCGFLRGESKIFTIDDRTLSEEKIIVS